MKPDIKTLERLLADDWTEVEEDGVITTREGFIDDLKSGKLVITTAKMDQPKVKAYTQTAVVTFRNTLKGNYDGTAYSGDYYITDTWIRKSARWQCVASHVSKIKK